MERICDNCMSRVPADSDKCTRCGIRFENTNPGGALPNGWVLGGRYTVGRYIDIDGEGVTYSAIDGDTLQRVTIKEYMPVTLCATRDEYGAIVAKPGNEVLFKTTRMDFRELYDTLLRMGLTEGLVQVLDVLEENNTAYAVMEKVEGPTLAEYLTKAGEEIEPNRAMSIMRPVMMGVEAMHTANLVHRGISPENIILESGGSAKLGGYAILALRQQGSELKPKLYAGYSAPEQYSASEFEGRYTDVYAIGAVLYRMVTGEVPFAADERRMQDNLRPARTENKEVPTFLSAGIARAMRLAPTERLQNIGDLRLALTGEGSREKKAGPLGLTKQQMIIGGAAIGAIVLILIVVLLISAFGGKGKGENSSTTSSILGVLPDFTGYTQRYVEERWGDDYEFEWSEEYSSDFEEGLVCSQNPVAGSDYDGEPIKLAVSLGENPDEFAAVVPDVVRLKQADAEAKLNSMEIPYRIMSATNDGNFEEGQVMRTDPVAGSTVDIRDDVVIVYVAGEKAVTMPNVVGDTFDVAASRLNGMGINVNPAQYVDNPGGQYVPGTVVKTSVDVGANVTGSVTLYIARETAMPDLVGKTEAEAKSTLAALESSNAKTRVTVNVVTANSSMEAGKVYQTSVLAGQELRSGTTVTIYVSLGPAETGGGDG